MENTIKYTNGYNISQARKMFDFIFGPFLFKCEMNDEKRRLDIFLKKRVKLKDGEILNLEDSIDMDHFNSFWNKNEKDPIWNVIKIDV